MHLLSFLIGHPFSSFVELYIFKYVDVSTKPLTSEALAMSLSLPRTLIHIHLAVIQPLYTFSVTLKDFAPGHLHSSLVSLLPLYLGSTKLLVPESLIQLAISSRAFFP